MKVNFKSLAWPWGSRIYPSRIVQRLEIITQLRLLRMAIGHRQQGPVPQLVDPFGGTLQYAVDEGGNASFWSDGAKGARSCFSSQWSGSQLRIPAPRRENTERHGR